MAGDGTCCCHWIAGKRGVTRIAAGHAGRVKEVDKRETAERVVVTGIRLAEGFAIDHDPGFGLSLA